MSDLQSVEFYEAEFRKRYLSIKSVKSKPHSGIAIKVYIGDHRRFFGLGRNYQEALAGVYLQIIEEEKQRKIIGPTHPAWEKDWSKD